MTEIAQAIRKIIQDDIKINVVVGKVKSVDEQKMTCDIDLKTSPDLLDVRLRSVIDEEEKGILIVPENDSYVLAGLIDNNPKSAFVCGFSKVKKIRLLTDEIELSGTDFGGVVKSEVVANQINEIKSDINNLKTIMSSWVITPADGGAALKAAAAVWYAQQLGQVSKTDFENDKVKHG